MVASEVAMMDQISECLFEVSPRLYVLKSEKNEDANEGDVGVYALNADVLVSSGGGFNLKGWWGR